MNLDAGMLISAAALGVALVFGVASHFRTKSFTDLSDRVARMEGQIETYFDAQEKYNALILHRDDDAHKIDRLLEKREQLEPIKPSEADLLAQALEEIIRNPNEVAGKRAAAAQMLSARKARDGA